MQVGFGFELYINEYYADADTSSSGQVLTYTITANTPSTWPSWLIYDSAHTLLFGIAPTGLATKTYTFDLVVSDGELSVSETITLNVNNPVTMSKTFESDYSENRGLI